MTYMKKRHVNTTLIILTRNEINGVKTVLSKIPFKAVDEYFAVDYRSTDGTVEYFRKHHIPVVQQKKPGRAEAFRIGVVKAQGKNLIFFSPDGNEDPRDIPLLMTFLNRGYDMVIASRFMQGSRNEEDNETFRFRSWANQGFTLLARILWGSKVTDSINGYRAITKEAFKKLRLDGQGFVVEYQMTIRALKMGLAIVEIPTREGDRIGGTSTSYAIPTGLSFLYYLVREIFIGKKFMR